MKSLRLRLVAPVLGALTLLGTMLPNAIPAAASCTAPCTYDNYITGTLWHNLVSYYPMYESSGTTMNDTSGNGHSGTYANVSHFGVSGTGFNGSTAIAETSNLNLANSNGVVTLAAWVIDEDTNTSCCSIMWEDGSNSQNYTGAIAWDLFDTGSNSSYPMTAWQDHDSSTSQYYSRHFPRVSDRNLWHFYVWEFDRFTNPEGCTSAREWIDDTEQSSGGTASCYEMYNVAFVNFQPLFIGARSGEIDGYKMIMRGLGIWTRQLTSSEKSTLYGAQFN